MSLWNFLPDREEWNTDGLCEDVLENAREANHLPYERWLTGKNRQEMWWERDCRTVSPYADLVSRLLFPSCYNHLCVTATRLRATSYWQRRSSAGITNKTIGDSGRLGEACVSNVQRATALSVQRSAKQASRKNKSMFHQRISVGMETETGKCIVVGVWIRQNMNCGFGKDDLKQAGL